MREEQLAILTDRQGRAAALKGVKIHARLHGLVAEVDVEQSYLNPHNTNIEAVYTFPLPLGAVLLSLEVEIAGQTLSGYVIEKKQAERDYEDAVTDGNSAVLLEESGPGLYTASLGNLMAGESAVIRYRYAFLLFWHGAKLRFMLPTTIAPRYGDALVAGLKPHQIPETGLDVEYPLDLAVTVEGNLASAILSSPNHSITVEESATGKTIRIVGSAVLDRDFVLNLESDSAQSSCILVPDRGRQVALASLRIPPVPGDEDQPLTLKVVIDCSGSMGGTSIAQARKAALGILTLLHPQDKFSITLFGNNHRHVFPTLMPADAKTLTTARNALASLDADMGGTEMENALNAVFLLGEPDGLTTLLLITDGEIHQHDRVIRRAQKSGHRVFSIGVGNAVAESFLQTLAKVTGGACELVAPQEGMAERVALQFHRMRQARLSDPRVEWPTQPDWQTQLPETLFAGDTVHVFAGFHQPVEGSVRLVVKGTGDITTPIISANEVEVPRLAAAHRMAEVTDSEEADGQRLALDYQLLSRWTHFLVIAERTDKAMDLPEVHKVPQMLAAGWGGISRNQSLTSSLGHLSQSQPLPMLAMVSPCVSSASDIHYPTRSRKVASSGRALAGSASTTPVGFISTLMDQWNSDPRQPQLPESIGMLEQWGLGADIVQCLRELVANGHSEAKVIAAFLHALTHLSIGESFDRPTRRAILKLWKQTMPGEGLDQAMQAALAALTPEAWQWGGGLAQRVVPTS